MRIALDTDPFVLDLFSALIKKFPEYEIILVPPATSLSTISFNYRFQYKIPAFLKKNKAELFVSMNGILPRAKITQVLILNELVLNKKLPSFLSKATCIITLSENTKRSMLEKFPEVADKVKVLNKFAGDRFQPLSDEEKELVKEKYSEGREFFLYSGTIDVSKNLINLLKAFSLFKKRQKSNMQLLITGKIAPDFSQLKKDLETYKYRTDVKLLDELLPDEQIKLTGSAYAMVCSVNVEDIQPHAMEAMQSSIPAITNLSPSLPDVCTTAVLKADPNNPADIAEKMMLLFKDEKKRSELILAGNAAMQSFSQEKSVIQLAEILSELKA